MKLPPVQYLIILGISACMFIAGVAVLGYGLYKWKHHPTGPPPGIFTGMRTMPSGGTGSHHPGTTKPQQFTTTEQQGTTKVTSSRTTSIKTSTLYQSTTKSQQFTTTKQQPTTKVTPYTTDNCDLMQKITAVIFLIDIANVQPSSLNAKLSYVRKYLTSIPPKVNLKGNWGDSKLGVAVYYGNRAFMLNNQLCSSDTCWTQTVNSLTGTLNRYNSGVHNATRGLQYINDEFGAVDGQLGYGVSRKVIIVADGYEFTGWTQAPEFAKRLRDNHFSVSTIIATDSIAIETIFQNCADNSYNVYRLDYVNEIADETLSNISVSWICRAYAITTPAPTVLPSKPTLTTTPEPVTVPGQLQPRVSPCSQYDDLVIIYHASTAAGHTKLTAFIGDELIRSLIGESKTWSSSPYNIAILTYVDNVVTELVNFTNYQNAEGYSNLLKSAPFVTPRLTQQLSNAYDLAGRRLREEGRYYSSKIIVVFTDYIDPFDWEAAKKKFDNLPISYVLGIEVGVPINRTLTIPDTELMKIEQYNDIDESNQLIRRKLGNQIAKKLCRYIPPRTTQALSTTTTVTPTLPPPAVEPREVWPDIAILIDVSSTIGSRDFETIREFLKRTMSRYSITSRNTRVSIVLFNSEVTVKAMFNQVNSYDKLQKALGEGLELGMMPRSTSRDLTKALSTLLSTVYVETISDYKEFKENFLWIFLSGSPSANTYTMPLSKLQKMGIRTEAIALGTEVDNWHLTQFGYTSFQVSNWTDDVVGIIAPNDDLSIQIYEDTTSRRTQPLSKIIADIYFVVDESSDVTAADYEQIKQFLMLFTSKITIDGLHCGVAITPFNQDISQNGSLALTYNQKTLSTYLNNFAYSNPTQASSNIGQAAQTLRQNFWKGNNRSTHIIFIVGSKSTIGADTVATILQDSGNVFAIGINKNVAYLSSLTKDEYRFLLNAPIDLLNWVEDVRKTTIWNPMTRFFKQFADAQENYMQSHLIPLIELNADFIKKFILDFGKKLNINPNGARIAAHTYTDQNSVENGFHFKDVKIYEDLEREVNALKLETNDVSLASDIAGAFVDIADYILLAENGWREGPTYVITLSTATRLIDDPIRTAEAKRKIFPKAQSLGLNLDGLNDTNAGFLRIFTPDFYAVVPNVQKLSIDGTFTTSMLNRIDRLYKTYNFPEPPPFESIIADFVFIIDHSATLTAARFEQVKQLMIDLINKGTFLPQNSRLGVLSYDSFGLIKDQIIYIKNSTTKDAITERINSLTFKEDPTPSNLTSVVEYIVNNGKTFGLRTNYPIIITLFAASQQITDYIPPSLTATFNARKLTYAFETSDLLYINEFLSPQRAGNALITNTFQLDSVYLEFISTGYQKWMTTYAGDVREDL